MGKQAGGTRTKKPSTKAKVWSEKEKIAALEEYISMSGPVNATLANGVVDREIMKIDQLMQVIDRDEYHRALTNETLSYLLNDAGVNNISDLKGKEFSSKTYVSTTKSMTKRILEETDDAGGLAAVIHYSADKPVKGIDVNKVLTENVYEYQHEVLLHRGLKIKVYNIRLNKFKKYDEIFAKIIN